MSPVYPFDEQLPTPGAAMEVADGVLWIRMPLPFALDHINLWLLRDGERWTAVDTGVSSEPVRAPWSPVLADHALSRIVVTHFHPDHLGLAVWLQQATGAPLWMSQGDYQFAHLTHAQAPGYSVASMVSFFRRHGLEPAMLNALEQRGNAYARGV